MLDVYWMALCMCFSWLLTTKRFGCNCNLTVQLTVNTATITAAANTTTTATNASISLLYHSLGWRDSLVVSVLDLRSLLPLPFTNTTVTAETFWGGWSWDFFTWCLLFLTPIHQCWNTLTYIFCSHVAGLLIIIIIITTTIIIIFITVRLAELWHCWLGSKKGHPTC